MKFTKDGIIDFVSKGRSYITWRTGIDFRKVKAHFYSEEDLEDRFPGVDIKYCRPQYVSYAYDITRGDFATGLRYVLDSNVYYLFIGADSFDSPTAQSMAIGKVQDGKIYLIYEDFSAYTEYKTRFIVISEEPIITHVRGFIPKGYYHSVRILPLKEEKEKADIRAEDINCLKIAYEGINAFKNLLNKFPLK